MDLKIQDVALLLNVSESTVRRWLADGTIPAYRLRLEDQQWRFSRNEIDRWLMRGGASQQSEDEEVQDEHLSVPQRGGIHQFSLYRALHRGLVFSEVPGQDKESVIRHTMELAADPLDLDAVGLTDLLLDRERLEPTALGKGIAIPHTRDFVLGRPYDIVVVAYPRQPLAYGALDGQPVHTLLFLFAANDKRHLHLLAKIAHFARYAQAHHLLEQRPDKATLLNAVKAWEGSLAINN